MRAFSFLLSILLLACIVESAKRCYSGSKNNYESRQCDTGISGNFVCQKFTCEGGKSDNFTVRACVEESKRCSASELMCIDQGGQPNCQICDSDECNSGTKLSLAMALSMLTVYLL